MKIELMLSKNQMRILTGLAQEPDRQRMAKIFLDLAAGRDVGMSTCFGCGEEFTRQIGDGSPTCSAECAKRYAVAVEKATSEAERVKLQDDRTVKLLNEKKLWQPKNHLSA